MYSNKVTAMKEPLEVDLQLMATEMDTSATRMKYLSNTIMDDSLMIHAFQLLWRDIKQNAPEITSLDDNTVLVEYLEEGIVLHETLENKYIIFDSAITQKIEEAFDKYKEVN